MDEKAPTSREEFQEECEHERDCLDCKSKSKCLHGVGNQIVSWSLAAAFLANEAQKRRTPSLFAAIDGLCWAISAIAQGEIVDQTLEDSEPFRPAERRTA